MEGIVSEPHYVPFLKTERRSRDARTHQLHRRDEAAAAEVTFDARQFFFTGRATLYGFYLLTELGADPASAGLRRLADLVAVGRLTPPTSAWSGPGARSPGSPKP